ncbi:hypothetical protein GLAREA_04202 [Glarea lozoyensis ATCC 20868]|uniref:Uncharacterized protein n=1 Tax=Glarea lozoyensis (strain ATCC 20868 / MF5171) TaxID=1116229 RepID=S3D5P3_GLAL2|nr:uncharacterized protein GLAREA_04202 [Glarea lozoyensis ATCC 20868]EPE27411.1 hypothetical protein GLAREA_04202 [Glarea lozoyensis ATCC 20868]
MTFFAFLVGLFAIIQLVRPLEPIDERSLIYLQAIGVALPENLNAQLPYPVSDLVFTGEIGGQKVALLELFKFWVCIGIIFSMSEGRSMFDTLKQVYAQAKSANPAFDIKSKLSANEASVTGRSNDLETRNKDGFFCTQNIGWPWGQVNADFLDEGTRYLRGKGRCGVNGHSCARIACSYRTAIFLCNDRPEFIQPACPYLASYVDDIVNVCGIHYDSAFTHNILVAGQRFDTDRYNVLVRFDYC